MLKIVLPQNVSKAVEHFQEAGWTIVPAPGKRRGTVLETGDRIMFRRSGDIPVKVADGNDVGICGSDWWEEKRPVFGKKLEILSQYVYGRVTVGIFPTLDFVVPKDSLITSPRDIPAGTVIVTEQPRNARHYLESYGWLNVVEMEKELEENPSLEQDPAEFRKWCREKSYLGIEIDHGGIDTSVWNGEGYGIMVNETGETLKNAGLRVVETLMEIRNYLIAYKDALQDEGKGPRIETLCRDLDRVERFSISGESEVAASQFRERLRV